MRLTLVAIAIGGLGACKKSEPEPEPQIAPPAAAVKPVDAVERVEPPPPPPAGESLAGVATPWGEGVPADHAHPEGVAITVFDIGDSIYDLSVRGLPAVNPAGDIAYASSISVGDLDWSTLSLVIAGADGAIKEQVMIFDAEADGAGRQQPLAIAAVRARAKRANALLKRSSWRPMLALESTGELKAGAEQKLASADRSVAAVFDEPALTIRTRDATAVIDAGAWRAPSCPRNVLLSGVWFDPPTGSVVARVGYETSAGCSADPVFFVARAR